MRIQPSELPLEWQMRLGVDPQKFKESEKWLGEHERQVFLEMWWNTQKATKQATAKYPDNPRWADYFEALCRQSDAELCKKYGVTQKMLNDLLERGNQEQWPREDSPAEKARVAKEAGNQPVMSVWDGSVSEVESYLKDRLRDPKSTEYIRWWPPVLEDTAQGLYWTVEVKYRSKNAFGGYVIENAKAYIRHDAVVEFKTLSRE